MRACIRDERGHFVAAKSMYIDVVVSPAEGEAWGLHQGLLWMEIRGYHKVIFELDCKTVVDDVHNNKPNASECDLLIDECRTLLLNYSDFIIAFTRRQTNGSAHALAQAALTCFLHYF
jgi:hypothetical protein